jgi:LPS sulfotransferase NodH
MAEASPQRLPALHELEMLSPWFDASAPALTPAVDPATSQGKRRLLLLLSAPRSGSYHLCRLLWHLGYGKPAEYFNPHLRAGWYRYHPLGSGLLPKLRRRLRREIQPHRLDAPWLMRLVMERSARSLLSGQLFFSAKLQPQQLGPLPAALATSFAPLARHGLWAPFEQVPPALVLLFRRDWLGAMVSHHLALCSGSFDQGRLFSFQLRPITALGSREALLSDLASYRALLEALLANRRRCIYPIHVLAFEDLIQDQPRTLAGLIQTLEPYELVQPLESHPALAVQIQRASDPWAPQQTAWKRHLRKCFQAEGLHQHPDATACAQAVAALNDLISR